jgi:hypothetical protein
MRRFTAPRHHAQHGRPTAAPSLSRGSDPYRSLAKRFVVVDGAQGHLCAGRAVPAFWRIAGLRDHACDGGRAAVRDPTAVWDTTLMAWDIRAALCASARARVHRPLPHATACARARTHALTGVSARNLFGTACSSVQWRKAPVLPVPSGGAHATCMQHTPCSVTTCSMLPIPCSTRHSADTVQHGWQRAASIGPWALPAAAKPRVAGAHATTRRWPAPGRTPRQARTRWRAHPREPEARVRHECARTAGRRRITLDVVFGCCVSVAHRMRHVWEWRTLRVVRCRRMLHA